MDNISNENLLSELNNQENLFDPPNEDAFKILNFIQHETKVPFEDVLKVLRCHFDYCKKAMIEELKNNPIHQKVVVEDDAVKHDVEV